MHSFTPSLSFLLSISLLFFPLQLQLSGSALAAELSLENTSIARGLSRLDHGTSQRKRHAELGHAARSNSERSDILLYPGRRAAGAQFTHFETGLGACGGFNKASDFVVALNQEQYGNGEHCGAQITITANGKSAQATIVDECLGCGFNNLDLTDGLYRFFDPSFFGTIQGGWEYGSGPPATKPTTSKAPPPPPKPTTSSKATAATSSAVTTQTSQISASASSQSEASTTASTAVPTETAENIGQLYSVMLGMGGILMGSLSSST